MADEDVVLQRLGEDLGYLLEDATFRMSTDIWAFVERNDGVSEQGVTSLVTGVDITGPLLDNWEVSLKPELSAITQGDIVSGYSDLGGRSLERPLLGLPEAWVSYSAGPFKATLGKQIFTWGQGDLLSPSDDVNASDQLDVPEAFKLGQPALRLDYASLDLGIELMISPYFVPSRQPRGTNPWSRDQGELADFFENLNGIRPSFTKGSRDFPEGLDELQLGARVSTSALIPNTDLSASILHANSHAPALIPEPITPQLIALRSIYPRYTEVATGFSSVLGDYEVHGEIAAHLTKADDEADDYLTYVIGGRRSWNDLPTDQLDEIGLTLEYAKEIILERIDSQSNVIQSPFDRTARNSILSKLDLIVDSDNSVTFGSIWNFDDDDGAFDLEYERTLSDNVTLAVSGQFFAGPSDSFFGEWSDNSRIYLELTWLY